MTTGYTGSETVTGGGKAARRHQSGILLAALLAIAAGLALPALSIGEQFWLVLIPIMVFGLSHGGADPLILSWLAGNREGSLMLITGLYVISASAFVGLVWFFPVLALMLFLLLSVWHFGVTDAAFLSRHSRPLLVWLSGSLPVLGPVIGHPRQTGELFAWLIGRDPQAVFVILEPAGPALAAVWLAGFGVVVYRHYRDLGARVVAELVLVGAALVLLPPLLAFAFYFCMIHSIRHFLSLAAHGTGPAAARWTLVFLARKAIPATLLAIALALAAWIAIMIIQPSSNLLVEAIRVMFWGLAALTVPHAAVVKLWWNAARPLVQDAGRQS